MKNILVVAFKYSSKKSDPYLTNDLVNELLKEGHKVSVIGYGELAFTNEKPNLTEKIIPIKSSLKFFKYLFIWPKLIKEILLIILKNKKYDQTVMFSPLTVMWPAALIIRFIDSKVKTAIIFDIFPIHQTQIGAMHRLFSPIAKLLEGILLSGFNDVTAMGTNNKKCIESYYKFFLKKVDVRVLPLWGGGLATKCSDFNFGKEPLKFIFGGQIIKGREIDTMIAYLSHFVYLGKDIKLDIYSKGQGFETLKSKFEHIDWITFENQLTREDYLAVLPTYDIGLIITDRRVDLPTFPSKIIDYVSAGIASYCIVEEKSDLLTIAEHSSLIYLNHFDFSEEETHRSLKFFEDLKHIDRDFAKVENGNLMDYFSIGKAVSRLIK